MTQHLFLGIIPDARLNPYRRDGENLDQAFARYQWNVQLAEAMLPSLHYLEIGLRNRVNAVISQHYGRNWLVEKPEVLISFEQSRDLDVIRDRHIREKHRHPNHDDYVAQVNFGFWYSYFFKRFDPLIWQRKHALETVFPHMPKEQRSRKFIQPKLLEVKNMRNRIAHHEPVWSTHPNIMDVHRTCYNLISAMSPEAFDQLKRIDRLSQVWNGKSA